MATILERWTPAGPIRSPLTSEAIAQEEARAAASVGEPAPLGLFAFAAATFTLSAVNAGWFSATNALYAMVPLIIFGGLVQLLAGMWAYRKGDTFAATAFGSFGGFNATYGLYVLLKQAGLITGFSGGAGVVGVFLICLGAIAAMLAIAALWRGLVLVGVLIALAITYIVLGAYLLSTGTTVLMHIGGYAGLVASVLAFYAGGAMVINSVSSHATLPMGPSLSPDNGAPATVSMPLRVQ